MDCQCRLNRVRDIRFSEGWISPVVAGVPLRVITLDYTGDDSLSLILQHLSFIAMHRMSECGKTEHNKGKIEHNENKVDSM